MATANSFVSSNIFNIYDEVVQNSLSYCVLCLRSEKERKLVAPKSLSIFLNSLSNAQTFRNLKVCYVCEAHAVSAVKFITAVKFALSLDHLLYDIAVNKHKNLRRDLKLRLNGLSRIEYPALTLAMECEAQYKSARSRANLSTTEVLVVSSQPAHGSGPESPVAAGTRRSRKISKHIETVVLDDDDEVVLGACPAPTARVAEVRLAQPAGPAPANQLVLHPLVPSADGKFYVPSLQNTIPTSDTGFAYITPEQLEAITSASSAGVAQVAMPEIEAILQNGCPNSMATYTVNVVDIEDTILPAASSTRATSDSRNSNNKKGAIAKGSRRNEVDNLLPDAPDEVKSNNKRLNAKATDVNLKKKCVESSSETAKGAAGRAEVADREAVPVPVPLRVSNGTLILNDGGARVKGPVPDSKRIDWEDKIPVDVISFMDAPEGEPRGDTCPRPSDLGVISEVRSLGVAPPPAAAAPPVPCIDLC